MQFVIKNRFTLAVIFKIEAENIEEALLLAIKSGANLSGANRSAAARGQLYVVTNGTKIAG